MKSVSVLSFGLGFLLAVPALASTAIPEGRFECPVEFTERYSVYKKNPDDLFPAFGGHYSEPRVRRVKMEFSFTGNVDTDHVVALRDASNVLPNFMLVTPEDEIAVNAYGDWTDGVLSYTMTWQSWYFGSDLNFVVDYRAGQDSLTLHHVTFDDNDGVRLRIPKIACRRS